LLKNKGYWEDGTDYTGGLLDSGLISKDILLPHEKTLYYMADTVLTGGVLNDEEVWTWRYGSLLEILGHLNSPESNGLLQRYLRQNDLYLKNTAVLRLLKNGQTVDPAELEKLAASNEYRLDLYNDLKELGRPELFPAKYRTQRYFAEAELYSYASDDYSPSEMEYIGERVAELNGVKKRFFLFRIAFDENESGDPESHLGMAGPYELDAKNLETSNDATGSHYDEPYNKKQVDKHFRILLENTEKYLKEKKEE